MKIFIPYKIRDTGGTSSFAKKFKKGLEKNGHEVFFEFRKDYDILFVIIQCYPSYLLHAKLNKKRIIQRLDGVYYWSVAKWKYPLLNLAPRLIHKLFSDYTVYQSQYSQYCADRFLGKRRDEKYTIIYNGVDTGLFSPEGENIENLRDNPNQKIFITVSKFRREDQIIPLIQSLEIYRENYNKNCKLLIIGDFSGKIKDLPKRYASVPFLQFTGKIKNGELPAYLRSSDCFLITHLNPPCPNNVIEAMACGLSICGVNDGAMSEITEPGKNSLLIPAAGDAFWKERKLDLEKFSDNLAEIMKNRESYAKHSRELVEQKFTLDIMINKYIKVF